MSAERWRTAIKFLIELLNDLNRCGLILDKDRENLLLSKFLTVNSHPCLLVYDSHLKYGIFMINKFDRVKLLHKFMLSQISGQNTNSRSDNHFALQISGL